MSKFFCNGVWFGSDDSKDIAYDDTTVYEKLKEIESVGVPGVGGGGAGSSSFYDYSRNVTLERNGCCRVLQFKGEVALSKIILKESDRPYRVVKSSIYCEKLDGSKFQDILTVNVTGSIVSDNNEDPTETVSYYGSIIWIVAVTESDTPILSSDNNIRFNGELKRIEIFENGQWVEWDGSQGRTISEVVPELPSDPDEDTLYLVVPNK